MSEIDKIIDKISARPDVPPWGKADAINAAVMTAEAIFADIENNLINYQVMQVSKDGEELKPIVSDEYKGLKKKYLGELA